MIPQTCPPCLTTAELNTLHTQQPHKILLLDVRSAEEYAAQHIPHAMHFPLDTMETNALSLPQHHRLVSICTNGGESSAQAAELLRKLGYVNAQDLCGGTVGWFEGEELLSS